MGMLGTILNALALQNALSDECADQNDDFAIDSKCRRTLYPSESHFAFRKRLCGDLGGTGNPFFSTDTAAALRAAELGAEMILMAKTALTVFMMPTHIPTLMLNAINT